jgi:hypothetical protein
MHFFAPGWYEPAKVELRGGTASGFGTGWGFVFSAVCRVRSCAFTEIAHNGLALCALSGI